MTQKLKNGIQLYRSGKYSDALTFFLSIPIQKNEENSYLVTELAYYIGLTYARLNQYDEALLYLEQVITDNTNMERVTQCRFSLGIIYSLTGRKKLADYEIAQLIDDGYEKAEVYAARAYLEWENKNTSLALEYYEKALHKNPLCLSALNGLGYVLACAGRDLTRALSLCKRAIDLNPSSPAFMDSVAWVYYKLGLLNEAVTYIQRAYRANDSHPEIRAHYNKIIQESRRQA